MRDIPNISITGLTGMSGAGKSTAAKLFSENGFTVIDCDLIARKVAQNKSFLKELSERFDERLLNSDGTLDRKKTAEVVFKDKDKNKKYFGIIFPYITYVILDSLRSLTGDVIIDAPTLFEAKMDMLCDNVVSVVASEQTCIKRIAARDNLSEEQAKLRLSAQHGEKFFRENSDFVIENDGGDLSEKVDKIIRTIRNR